MNNKLAKAVLGNSELKESMIDGHRIWTLISPDPVKVTIHKIEVSIVPSSKPTKVKAITGITICG